MKLLKRILAAAALLCLLLYLSPAAFADNEDLYKNKTWDQVIEEFFQRYDVDEDGISLGYYNMVTGEEHYFNGDQYMVAGSMFKVPLNMCFTEKIHNGEMDWDTKIGSISYKTLLHDTIVHSSNDYAKILWQELGNGKYRTYREIIAPYMGEDPATVDEKYYENNFFTARQMIYCLRMLAGEPERFPGLIEAMQKAEPDEYFRRSEDRFDIAHKYGFLNTEYHLYMDDCAIAYTDDPIVFVMFTDNIERAYEVMAEYSTLMCDYTQYNTSLRLEAEALAKAAAATPAPAIELVQPSTSPEGNFPGSGGGIGAILAVAGVIAALLLAVCAALRSGKRKNVRPGWAIAAAGLAAAAMLLSLVGVNAGTLVARAEGDPAAAATEFMDALMAGDYATAYSHMAGYSGLGLENAPADAVGQKMYDALRESYAYELTGDCTVDKLEARQQLSFTYLDLTAMEEQVQEETLEQLKGIVQSRPKSQLYDENDNYLPEVAQEAYAAAVSAVLESAEEYYTTVGILLELEYSDEQWRVVPSPQLLKAVSGGTY